MIGASTRRREDARAGAFDLHRRLAAGDAWHRRLTMGSLAALGVSAAAWIVGVPLVWHGGLVAAAFVAGMAWPVRGATARAFAYIAERSGLAYETALTAGEDDAYGLHAALDARARSAAARVRPPARQPWWIAALALALAILLLPASELVAPRVDAPGAPSPSETAEPVAPEPEAPEAVADPEQPDDLERAREPDGVDGAAGDGDAQDAGAGSASEGETLSRLLENLRERDPFRPVDRPEEPPGDAPRDGRTEPEQGQDPSGAQRPSEGAQRDEEGEATDRSDAAEGEAGSEGDREGEEGAPEAGAEEGEQEGEPGAEGREEGEPQPGDSPAEGEEPGDQEGQLSPDADDGVGEGPGAAVPTQAPADAPPTEPEFLPGQLEAGPENPGGTVLLPGEDELDVPPDLRRGEYRRAVEEAVTDGQVPLEYQDVIRNYFR